MSHRAAREEEALAAEFGDSKAKKLASLPPQVRLRAIIQLRKQIGKM